ncbi:MAG: sigma-70 family RNA polymerase sigma factor [Oscillospiraceae bacterium]|nr:sigma-70 family RNA polymerase sigma factor [Oscillospiraceae bacterium]
MDSERILHELWVRDEEAIEHLALKYASYCHKIASNFLIHEEEIEEVLNDVWLGTWKSIPPNRPDNLKAYLAKLTRNISNKLYRDQHAKKRFHPEVSSVYEELEECIPSTSSLEEEYNCRELANCIDSFLRSLNKEERVLFVRRYWYFDSITDLANRFGFTESSVKTKLWRMRTRLKKRLSEGGLEI